MYEADTYLPHLLSPSAYVDESHCQQEIHVLRSSWHLVGTTAELSKPGDFRTAQLFGNPVQVRRFEGGLQALSNVCAHRHCMITAKKSGRSATMQCQYHGWEFGADGRTRRIPQPKNFTQLDRERHRLPVYRVDTCGQLVFVCLDNEAPDLVDFLGDMFELVEERFGKSWRLSLNWNPSFDVNWKIPVENTLESYHVPNVHPNTFKTDPGEDRSQHIIKPEYTAFQTKLPFCAHSNTQHWFQKLEGLIIRMLGEKPTNDYWQYHLFPNLLFSFTDAISLVHCVIPNGPRSATGAVRQFGRVGSRNGPRRWLGACWGKAKAAITKKILVEDLKLYASIQAGLATSQQTGILGRCEERIFHFQQFMLDRVSSPGPAPEDK